MFVLLVVFCLLEKLVIRQNGILVSLRIVPTYVKYLTETQKSRKQCCSGIIQQKLNQNSSPSVDNTVSTPDASGYVESPEKNTVPTPDNMDYPDPESQEEEEIVEEIDTSKIQKESVEMKEEDNLFVSL